MIVGRSCFAISHENSFVFPSLSVLLKLVFKAYLGWDASAQFEPHSLAASCCDFAVIVGLGPAIHVINESGCADRVRA